MKQIIGLMALIIAEVLAVWLLPINGGAKLLVIILYTITEIMILKDLIKERGEKNDTN